MKLDMGAAWNKATALIGRNRDVILVIAGVFFFLPSLAATMLVPQVDPAAMDTQDMQAVLDVMTQAYLDNWWLILISAIAQGIGTLALLRLLTDRARPTVGEAIRQGAVSFPSYFAANLLVALAIGAIVGIALAINPLAVLLALPIAVYLAIKFSLIMPVIAIDRVLNPMAAIARSWRLTKGNSLRLFLFYALIFVATIVIFALATMVFGVVFAAIGGETEKIGNAVVGSFLNAGFVVIFFAVLAGVHRQLAGDRPEELNEVLE